MLRELGKLGSAVFLGCLLTLMLCTTGVFAQSAQTQSAARIGRGGIAYGWQFSGYRAHVARHGNWGSGWFSDGYASHHGFSYGRTVGYVRTMRTIRVTQIVHVTKVRIIRVTKTMRISQLIRQVRVRSVPGCGGDC